MRHLFHVLALPGVVAALGLGVPVGSEEIDWRSVTEAARAFGRAEAASASGRDRLRKVGDVLQGRARRSLAALEHPGAGDLETRRGDLLRQLRTSIGIDHFPAAAAAARAVEPRGVVDRGDYVVEKIVYETLPGMPVPAHVYRPARPEGRLPAILFVPGHWWADSKARPSFQAFSINMARLGFVVLAYDPFGQGERGVSFRDHRRTAALLAGISQQGIVVFESLCALEVLTSRVDVDPRRIGMTGASGGGYNTWTVTALDPRIAAAVPVVGTSEFYEQIAVCRPLDWYRAKEHCHFVPRLLRYANNHELLALTAPRPLLVVSATRDESFPLEGIRQVVDYGRTLYAGLGESARFGYFEDETAGHGYQKAKREAAYGWFLRWLKGVGDGRPMPEPPTETREVDDPELRCFPAGQRRGAGPGIVAHVGSRLRALPPPGEAPAASALREALRAALGLGVGESFPQAGLRSVRSTTVGPVRIERVLWEGVDGIEVPALLLAPAAPWKGAVLAAADDGKEALLARAGMRQALESGCAIVLADVRGVGELALEEKGWIFAVSLLLGENFVGWQALDLIVGRRALTALPALRGKPVGFWGVGPSTSLAALYAAVLDSGASWLVAEGGFVTYRSFVERPRSLRASYRLAASRADAWERIDREIPPELVVFDVLRHFDVPDLLASLGSRPALVVRPIDGDWEEMGEAAAARQLSSGRFRWPGRPALAVAEGAGERLGAFIRAALGR